MQPFNGTPDELLDYLREHSDDIERVDVVVAGQLSLTNGEGSFVSVPGACCVVRGVAGNAFMLAREDLQDLLNAGVLQRLRIPVRLIDGEAQ